MAKHKPIKFETTLETSLKKELLKIIKENRKAKTTLNATLALIALSGVLTFGIVAPNTFSALTHFIARRKKERYKNYRELWRGFHDMKKRNEIKFVKKTNHYLVYKPTLLGKQKIKKMILEELTLEKPKKWDKKWRLVIFDIPENKRRSRDALRKKLSELGFYQCQKSAWIHPFPCLEEIEFIKEYFRIKPFVKMFLINEMTDGRVLYHFRNLIKTAV
jgi:hypothetical protein